mmetsp:Transcript_2424/g.7060  ORF Transcript_2424/g.7060 Transcript_2424/m.7060 type:complete len:316 (-) Transcript_2424:23-970(-)
MSSAFVNVNWITPSDRVHVHSSACVAANSVASSSVSPLTTTLSFWRWKTTFTCLASLFCNPSFLNVISTSSFSCLQWYWSVSPLGVASARVPGLTCAGFCMPILSAKLFMSPLDLFSRCFLVAATHSASVLSSFRVKLARYHASSLSSNTRAMKQSPRNVCPGKPHCCTMPETLWFSSNSLATPLSSQYTFTPRNSEALVGNKTGKISTLDMLSRWSRAAGSISPESDFSCRFTPVRSCNCAINTALSTASPFLEKYCSTKVRKVSFDRSSMSSGYSSSSIVSPTFAGTNTYWKPITAKRCQILVLPVCGFTAHA